MQIISCYAVAQSTVGVWRDNSNAKRVDAPTLVLGVEAQLKLRLFLEENVMTPYPIDRFSGVASWRFDIDADYDNQTTAKIAADNANIAVATVTENDQQYTEFTIPLPEMNSTQLNTWLGTAASRGGLTAELLGMDGDGKDVFVLQLENISVRNRVIHPGEPTQPDPTWLDAEQVRALIAAGYVLDFQVADNVLQLRMRSAAAASSTWSAWASFCGIGANGNWTIGGTDTGFAARGPAGPGYYTRRLVSADASLASGDYAMAAADVTLTLPAVAAGSYVRVSAVGSAAAVTIAPATGETIDGESSLVLEAHETAELYGTADGWIIAELSARSAESGSASESGTSDPGSASGSASESGSGSGSETASGNAPESASGSGSAGESESTPASGSASESASAPGSASGSASGSSGSIEIIDGKYYVYDIYDVIGGEDYFTSGGVNVGSFFEGDYAPGAHPYYDYLPITDGEGEITGEEEVDTSNYSDVRILAGPFDTEEEASAWRSANVSHEG